jgi:hypothetical protein
MEKLNDIEEQSLAQMEMDHDVCVMHTCAVNTDDPYSATIDSLPPLLWLPPFTSTTASVACCAQVFLACFCKFREDDPRVNALSLTMQRKQEERCVSGDLGGSWLWLCCRDLL